MNGIHEVRGSIPLSSTINYKGLCQIDVTPFSLCIRCVNGGGAARLILHDKRHAQQFFRSLGERQSRNVCDGAGSIGTINGDGFVRVNLPKNRR